MMKTEFGKIRVSVPSVRSTCKHIFLPLARNAGNQGCANIQLGRNLAALLRIMLHMYSSPHAPPYLRLSPHTCPMVHGTCILKRFYCRLETPTGWPNRTVP